MSPAIVSRDARRRAPTASRIGCDRPFRDGAVISSVIRSTRYDVDCSRRPRVLGYATPPAQAAFVLCGAGLGGRRVVRMGLDDWGKGDQGLRSTSRMRSDADIPRTLASSTTVSTVGPRRPFSIRDTKELESPARAASSIWLMPAALRRARRTIPNRRYISWLCRGMTQDGPSGGVGRFTLVKSSRACGRGWVPCLGGRSWKARSGPLHSWAKPRAGVVRGWTQGWGIGSFRAAGPDGRRLGLTSDK